jgi:hypothetical protein
MDAFTWIFVGSQATSPAESQGNMSSAKKIVCMGIKSFKEAKIK